MHHRGLQLELTPAACGPQGVASLRGPCPLSAYTRQKLSAAPFAGQYAVEAIERHGYHPGPAAELSALHGGPPGSWEYVIRKLPGP
ncbi:hypothetical protein [Streptomyces pseudovenezuelae]|uniref:Uncharacterized protein n=1 Tax=Streptomyces pseudovenezuelae TaxID=67350 RepID=A0ABT6M2U8_9ACTN|nr:hypothetical protein [Streptomyces pseudovenezuelae]MDH6222877.1 hypothetical protein [Streptomyces pseudovenezuelae]